MYCAMKSALSKCFLIELIVVSELLYFIDIFRATDINLSVKYAMKLLVEIEYVIEQCEDLENANYLEFFGDFKVRLSIL